MSVSRILAIDPGPVRSAYVVLDGQVVREHAILDNAEHRQILALRAMDQIIGVCAVEMIASYGMAVGAEVFETCVEIGRLCEIWKRWRAIEPYRVTRLTVKQALCHDSRAKDANIRAALIDRFGGPSCIKKGGALYKVRGDEWAALAVACTYQDLLARPAQEDVRG